MSVPRLDRSNAAFLLIDVQERLIGQMHQHERLVRGCRYVCQVADVLRLPLAVTEQYVKAIGKTVSAVREVVPAGSPVFEKTQFSACIDPVRSWLVATNRPNILICGMEAHVCVLQTGLDLQELGFQVFWISDAISGGEVDQIAPARRRLERGGVIVTGCVSMTYEVMRDAAASEFKTCLPLVKNLRNGLGA